jgi:hypothetical protein
MAITLEPYHMLLDATRQEVNRNRINLLKMVELIDHVNMFSQESFAHECRAEVLKYLCQHQKNLLVVVAGHKDPYANGCRAVGGAITFLSNAAGAGSLYTASKTAQEYSKYGSDFARGFDQVSPIFTSRNQAAQELNQATLKELDQKSKSIDEEAKRCDNQALSSAESVRKIRELILQFFLQL